MPGIKKYRASTLIEVVVAMIIILICAGMGITVFSNLGRDMNGNKEMMADIYLNKVLIDSKINKEYTDKSFEFTDIRIERSVLPYKKEKRIQILKIEAYSSQYRKIGGIRELILVTP